VAGKHTPFPGQIGLLAHIEGIDMEIISPFVPKTANGEYRANHATQRKLL